VINIKGKVKIFDSKRGFGFIRDNYDTAYFVHITEVEGQKNLYPKQEVEFTPVKTNKGLAAKNVRVLKNG